MIDFLVQKDIALFLFINGSHSPLFDTLMWGLSHKLIWIPLYIYAAYLIIRNDRRKGIAFVLMVGLLIALSDLSSVHLFKNVFERLRPCHNPEIKHLVHIVNNKCGGKFSFVSSHAANSFAIATYVFLILRRSRFSFGIGMLIWATLVSYSRIYLGVHFPADVFCGALLGVLCGFITFYVAKLVFRIYEKHRVSKENI